MDAVQLSSTLAVTWVVVGIIISLLLPVAVSALRRAKPKGLERLGEKPSLGTQFAAAWQKYGGNRYLGIAAAATFVAIALVFLLGLEFQAARDATLAGFAWESFVSKL